MALAPLGQTLLITAGGKLISLSDAVTIPSIPPTPTPTPAPSFSAAPTIGSDGTPQVGEQLIGAMGTVANLGSNALTRRWLLGSTVLSTALAYTPTQTGIYTFQNRVIAPDGATVVVTAGVDVTVAAATVAPTPPPTAPVLANLSSGWVSGQNPPNWDSLYDGLYFDPDSGAGDELRVIWRLGSGAFTTEAWVPFSMDLLSDGFTYGFLTDGSLYAGGTFQAKVQAGRNVGLSNEVLSAESNIWADTLAASGETASTLVTATGTGKSQFVTVSGTPALTAMGQGGFNSAPTSVRVTQARMGKRQFQATVTTDGNANIWIGVDDGTSNFNSGFVRPGRDNSAGFSFYATAFDWGMYVGGAQVQTAGTGAVQTGDVITLTFDTVAATVSVYRTRGGVTTQYGTAQPVALSGWFANLGFESDASQVLLLAAGQVRALDTGYFPYDK